MAAQSEFVMPGLEPGISRRCTAPFPREIAGTRPAMTESGEGQP